MNRSARLGLLLTLTACAVLALGGLLVHAAPPIPATFYGTVKVNGANVTAGTLVDAYIGGVSYASTSVQTSGADTVYVLHVPGDIPEISGRQGGTEGETIQFLVRGLTCDQTGVWSKGTQTNLNLTATGALPTPMPARVRLPLLVKSWVVSHPEELAYDDDTYDGWHKLHAAAVRFSVTERREVKQLGYYLTGESGPVQVVIYNANWEMLYSASVTPGGSGSRWFNHDVSGVTVGPGDFYVAMIWPSAGAGPHLGEDTTPPHAGRSYGSFESGAPPFGPLDNPPVDLMIRAVVQ